ncbi:R-spondin-4-like [Patiria miniata]|uniref:R-spondin Fu-CRD domain-containing protein n=1 Tax=Patiria miniata TaxID=46514 RepID=A0A914A0R8_PATMI|nr:R-spondin-4-like [Patiria miniata]
MVLIDLEMVLVLCLSVLLAVVDTGETWRVKTRACPQGCNSCSLFNGCITCKPRYLLLLHRSGMKQVGYCRRTCPLGYYASRGGDINRCSKCQVENCEDCFARNFCVRCQSPYYAHEGKCFTVCPEGTWGDRKSGDCLETVHCEVSEWGSWSTCRKNGADCGYKWGEETRMRGIMTQATPGGKACPELTETRKCRILQRNCPVDCGVSEWSSWSPCSKDSADCGYKWGEETRVRHVSTPPSNDGKMCPDLTETRECRMLQRHCSDDEADTETGKKKGRKNRRNNRRRKNRRRDRPRKSRTHSSTQTQGEGEDVITTERTRLRSRTEDPGVQSREISRDLPTDLLSI